MSFDYHFMKTAEPVPVADVPQRRPRVGMSGEVLQVHDVRPPLARRRQRGQDDGRWRGSNSRGRFLQHVLPTGFVRIRHFGFLANRCRDEKLTLMPGATGYPPVPTTAPEDEDAFGSCFQPTKTVVTDYGHAGFPCRDRCPACLDRADNRRGGDPVAPPRHSRMGAAAGRDTSKLIPKTSRLHGGRGNDSTPIAPRPRLRSTSFIRRVSGSPEWGRPQPRPHDR